LTATATDSARLSRKSVSVDPSLRFSVNVPARTLADIVSLFEGSDSVEISANAEKIIFSFGTTLVSSRLISGEYPVSSSIIPQNFSFFLEVNAQQLLNAIDRVSVLATDHAPVVKLAMDDEQVEVSSTSDQTGSGVEKLTTIQYTGERLGDRLQRDVRDPSRPGPRKRGRRFVVYRRNEAVCHPEPQR
jgi:DNA polymerase-3 subunit beta